MSAGEPMRLDDPRHGTVNGYRGGGCRCRRCRRANADAQAARRRGLPLLVSRQPPPPAGIPRPGDWAARAACKGDPSPDDWFVAASLDGRRGNGRALRICQEACEVRGECRAHYEGMAKADRALTIAGGVMWSGRGDPVRRDADDEERLVRRRAEWRESARRRAARKREARASADARDSPERVDVAT